MKNKLLFWAVLLLVIPVPALCLTSAQLVAKYTFENTITNEINPSQVGIASAQSNGKTPVFEKDNLRNSTVLHQYFGVQDEKSISYVQFPNPLKSTDFTDFTVSLWVNRLDGKVFDAIWSFYNENTWGTNNDHDRFFLTPNLYLSYNGPNGFFDCNWPEPHPTNCMSIGNWNLVTVTAGSFGFRIYLNGARIFDVNEQFSWTSNIASRATGFGYANIVELVKTAEHFYFGFGSWWGSAELLLDDLLIYNGALSDNEIKELYDASAVDPQWKIDADARIEQHRKNDVTIRVTKNGQIVKDAIIQVDMFQPEFLFGCNIFQWEETPPEGSPSYNQLFAELFNFATTKFYWSSYERVKDHPIYRYSDAVAAWCMEKGIQIKGHPLAWNSADPAWMSDLTNEEIYQRQMNRITDCVSRFQGQINVWDVVNEMITYKNYQAPSPRLTQVIEKTGPLEFTRAAFRNARAANPEAILLINDYIQDERYSTWLNQLIDDDNESLFDIIGVQSHTHVEGKWSNEKILEVCNRLSKFEKPIHFSELTILSTLRNVNWFSSYVGDATISTMAGEQYQKEEVIRYYTMLFSHPSVEGITWWDFSDKGAWLKAPGGLYREDLSPKPAGEALKKLIREKWATHVTLSSGVSGEAQLRAFRGSYSVTVTLPGGKVIQPDSLYTIGKGINILEIEIPDETTIYTQVRSNNFPGNIYIQNHQLYVRDFPPGSDVEICNLLGQSFKKKINDPLVSFYLPDKLYIVKITNREQWLTRKIIMS